MNPIEMFVPVLTLNVQCYMDFNIANNNKKMIWRQSKEDGNYVQSHMLVGM